MNIQKLYEAVDFSKVQYEIEALPEDITPEENLSIKETGVDHSETIEWINSEIDTNQWVWCTIKVTAKIGQFTGIDYLGCCSYQDENDFIANSGYYEDMKENALSDLRNEVEANLLELFG